MEKITNSKLNISADDAQFSPATQIESEKRPIFTTQSLYEIKFIGEKEPNIAKTVAPEAPMLIKLLEGGTTKPFLRKGIVGQLVGAGGIGKTHWLTQLALSVATGATFLEKYRVEQGRVFLGLGENSNDDIHRLIKKMVDKLFSSQQQVNAISTNLAVMSFAGRQSAFLDKNNLETPAYKDFLQALKDTEPAEGWMLIILDPVSRFLGSNSETDNAAATQFISLLEKIAKELKGQPTILFGHHMSKASLGNGNTDQTAARGSSALTDGVRWQANLDRVQVPAEEHTIQDESPENKSKNKRPGNTMVTHPSMISFKVVKSNFTVIPDAHVLYKDVAGCLHNSPQISKSCDKPEEEHRNHQSGSIVTKTKRDYVAAACGKTNK